MKTDPKTIDRDQLGQLIREKAHKLIMLTSREYSKGAGTTELEELEEMLWEWSRRQYNLGPDKASAIEAIDHFNFWLSTKEKLVRRPSPDNSACIGDNILEIIKQRRSIRFWKLKKVPEIIIQKIIESATYAPCAFNRMSWKFIFKENCIFNIDNEDSSNESMFNRAPVIIYTAIDERLYEEKYAPAIDAGTAVQNMLLTAHAFGLGGCPVYQCEIVDQNKLRYELNLPDYYTVYCAVLIGYPDEIPFVNNKVSPHEVTDVR